LTFFRDGPAGRFSDSRVWVIQLKRTFLNRERGNKMRQPSEWTDVGAGDQEKPNPGIDVFAIMWRRKWIVACMVIVSLGLGYLYFLNATPVYQSAAQILLIKKEAELPMIGPGGQVNYEDTLSTHMILLQSPMIVERAVQKHDLGELESIRKLLVEGVATSKAEVASVIIEGLLTTRTGEKRALDPNVMNVTFEGLDPDECQIVLRAVIKEYQNYLGESYKNFSDETLALIKKANDTLGKQLRETETEYRKFRAEESELLREAGSEAYSLHETRMAEIERQRSAVLLQNTLTKARIETIKAALESGGNREALTLLVESYKQGTTDNRPGPRSGVEEKLFETMLEEQVLLESYGVDHPQVKAIHKVLELMRLHLGNLPEENAPPVDFLAVYLDSLSQELKVGEQQLAECDALFAREREAARKLAGDQIKDETYRNTIARMQTLYDAIVNRLQEMEATPEYGGVETQLLYEPSLGELVRPQLLFVLVAAGALGLVIGVGLAYMVDIADKSFRSPDEIRRQLGLPIVGHIPTISPEKEKRSHRGKQVAQGALDRMLCTHYRPKSRHAEAYRAVRTSLYFSTHGEGHKVIQVTSPNPGDGKTTLAGNLAVSIANSGKRVLLLDGDFRRPRLHKHLGLDNTVGVSSIINNETEIADAVQETSVENLSAICCGPRPDNPAELLTSPRFKELIDVFREQYDFVIVDSPPLLAVTDPAVIAPRVDAVLLVIRLAKNARDGAVRATEILDALGAQVLGIVVNGIGRGAGYGYGGYRYGSYRYRAGYSYGYGYGYRYGDGSYYAEEKPEQSIASNGRDGIDQGLGVGKS